jgi:hypothetical protein
MGMDMDMSMVVVLVDVVELYLGNHRLSRTS